MNIVANKLYITDRLDILVSDIVNDSLFNIRDKNKSLYSPEHLNPIVSVLNEDVKLNFQGCNLSDLFEIMSYYKNSIKSTMKKHIDINLYKNSVYKYNSSFASHDSLKIYPIISKGNHENKLLRKFKNLQEVLLPW